MGGQKDENSINKKSDEGQCQFFVVRKKRLCRMTVRPGRAWCGEHEPRPPEELTQTDKRIPCPYDPKHTVYTSKLEKHLTICNARPEELPPYIVPDINVPAYVEPLDRRPLTEVPRDTLLKVIEKINRLYIEHIEGNIASVPEQEIHDVVVAEFSEGLRAETSRRHLRQASALLRLAEAAGLNCDGTCYVELGAGKGQLSYYVSKAWCGAGRGSGVALVDRAALRHKRDNKLGAPALRIRADLRHLALHSLSDIQRYRAVVGLAKHLCGVATDYGLRCLAHLGEAVRGVVMATCCHHRCHRDAYTGTTYLQELGVSGEELNIILSVVSWATCGDGRARTYRRLKTPLVDHDDTKIEHEEDSVRTPLSDHDSTHLQQSENSVAPALYWNTNNERCNIDSNIKFNHVVDIENLNIHDKSQNIDDKETNIALEGSDNMTKELNVSIEENINNNEVSLSKDGDMTLTLNLDQKDMSKDVSISKESVNKHEEMNTKQSNEGERLNLSLCEREAIGRRAKALVDWGRVLFLRDQGMEAKLCYYVPTSVSLENMCIVATRTP